MLTRRQSDEPSEGRRTEVLLEQLRSDFRVVAEGHGLLAKEILDMKQNFGQRLDSLEGAMVNGFGKVWDALHETNRQMNARFEETNGRLDGLTTRFDAHDRAHTHDSG